MTSKRKTGRTTKTAQFALDWANRKVVIDGVPVNVRPRLFAMYCVLYLARIEASAAAVGSVDIDQIQLLPGWEKNSRLSVGKQMQRHIQEMAERGLRPIESVQKIKGPFRLLAKKGKTHSDVSGDTVRAYLYGVASPPLVSHEEQQLYRYVGDVSEAVLSLDDGKLRGALAGFRDAAKSAHRPYLRAVALQNVARILERLGNYDDAFTVVGQSLAALRDARMYRTWIEARSLAIQGSLYFRSREYDRAERLYQRALSLVRGTGQLRVLGEIYNGFGNACFGKEQYSEALAFYQQALEQWVLVDNLVGIQAVYFNIGRLHLHRGKQLLSVDSRSSDAAFEAAKAWFIHCVELCQKAGVGYDDNDAEIGLASIYRHKADFQKAMTWSEQALMIAKRSQNARGLRHAYRSLLKVCLAQGDKDRVHQVLSEAKTVLEPEYTQELETLARGGGTPASQRAQ